MPASAILAEVHQAHLSHFGEPDTSFVFDDGRPREGFPNRIDVLVWRSNADCDIATFATIGMSDCRMTDADYRAELHFAIRRRLEEDGERHIARFLANLAMYPFQIRARLNWWHTIRDPGGIPFFDRAQSVILHPRFVLDGWDRIETTEGEVRLLNVIPITPEERDLRSRDQIRDAIYTIDMFSPR